jgi:hypothetical protein
MTAKNKLLIDVDAMVNELEKQLKRYFWKDA